MAEIFHVLNRGVDKRIIFIDKQDHLRFVHDLFEFNDIENTGNNYYLFKRQSIDVQHRYIKQERHPRKLLVKILAFALMPNHYHLMLEKITDHGIPNFMKKLNAGYSKYFNKKYQRNGTLFQGRYKSVPIKTEAHFLHLPFYIHCNPLDIVHPEWREKEMKDYKNALKFLKNYRWSSHLDYCGIKNFPSITQRDFLETFFGGPDKYLNAVTDWLKNLELESLENVSIEPPDSN